MTRRADRSWNYVLLKHGHATRPVPSFVFLILLCIGCTAVRANAASAGARPQSDFSTSAPLYWELPTGSRIAYRKFSSGKRSKADSVIFLHGGPGAYALGFQPTVQMLNELARTGRDVYAYDQVGGGLSERLADIREYTVQRHIDDLEAIRNRIGAERLILFGSSWGATLAAHYSAQHPDRVAGLILSGPGVIHPGDWKESYGRVEDRMTVSEKAAMREFLEGHQQLESAMEALATNPAEALRILPDEAGGQIFDQVTNSFYLTHLGCPGAKFGIRSKGYGFWANRMTGMDLDRTSNPTPKLRALSMPTLILRGSCEYMKPKVAEQYREVLKGKLVTIEGAGHMIWWEKPREFLSVAESFLSSLR